jgi:hypothetical protein
LKGVL